jgi:uncharacterized Zn finger protein (UPF0148 family)
MNNDSLKQGAYYLLRGGTLLSEPCKKCGNLQIRYKGEILCMNCQNNNQKKNSSDLSDEKERPIVNVNSIDEDKQSATLNNDSKTKIDKNLVLDEVEEQIIRSISDLGVKLITAEYSKEYRTALKSIRKSLKILEMIRRIKRL